MEILSLEKEDLHWQKLQEMDYENLEKLIYWGLSRQVAKIAYPTSPRGDNSVRRVWKHQSNNQHVWELTSKFLLQRYLKIPFEETSSTTPPPNIKEKFNLQKI